MAGKTNYKQIAVYKNRKALIEFMDDTRYEKDAMAWPHTPTSRIRLSAKDYSAGKGNLAVDAYHNLSPDEFFRLSKALTEAKETTAEDYKRCEKYLERLQLIKTSALPEGSDAFVVDRMITEAEEELEKMRAGRLLYSETKILNYEKYINPENEEERQVTMLKVSYHAKLNYPYAFTVATGWGVPLITKQKGVTIKEGSVRFESTVNILLDEKSLFPMLHRVEDFLRAMTQYGLANYFETVTNPVLYYQLEEENS